MFGSVLPGGARARRLAHFPPERHRRTDVSLSLSLSRSSLRESPPGDPTVQSPSRHGSGQNTSPNDRGDHRQVQPDPVHGRPLRAAPRDFGSAGSEVRCSRSRPRRAHSPRRLAHLLRFRRNGSAGVVAPYITDSRARGKCVQVLSFMFACFPRGLSI